MNRAFNFGDTTMYVSALLKGRGLEASARFVAPISVHLHVYEFCDGALLAGELNVYVFGVSLDALLAGVEELEINVEICIHEAFVKALEVVKYNGVGTKFQENGFSICLEEFEFEMEVTQMPCKHVFHGGRLTQWLERSHLCQLCHYEMAI
ncbi:E3 ubiquitin-protein ligase RING1-like [Phoenix dactylifera]|uniref:E3 ubiquitin-protein ligase RING1-like n=1 Tax=Phoenix dactylifera TaxID=42345 RepID=A0A8B9ARB2_PHODC|nr:E3 ubiquitin-protein ligase RING1-like [Phoenix dactylifera]